LKHQAEHRHETQKEDVYVETAKNTQESAVMAL